MTIATAIPATCADCGTTAPMHMMLMNDQGAPVCASCMASSEAKVGMRKRTKNLMLAPAMISVLAYLSFLVPVLNLAAPGILAAIAFWNAIGGVRLHNELAHSRDDHGVSPGLRSGLLVMSVLTILFASIPLAIQILAWLALAFGPSLPHRW